MKLEARTRLQASTQVEAMSHTTVSGPVEIHMNTGQVEHLPNAKAYDHWASSNPVTLNLRIGRYAIPLMRNGVGVAELYKDVIPKEAKAGDKQFRFYAADRRRQMAQAMRALQTFHHPMMGNVKRDYDEEMKYLNEHDKPLFARRTQNWFNRLDHETKAEYVEKYPGTKFRARQRLTAP